MHKSIRNRKKLRLPRDRNYTKKKKAQALRRQAWDEAWRRLENYFLQKFENDDPLDAK